MPSSETVLIIDDINIPFGAGINISETLQPINNGDTLRSINGVLKDLTNIKHQKFELSISGGDTASPALGGIFKGATLIITPISLLRDNVFPAAMAATLIRDPLVTSVFGYQLDPCLKITPSSVGGTGNRDITFAVPVDYIIYRPVLTMLVLQNTFNTNEYTADETYQMDLEEV